MSRISSRSFRIRYTIGILKDAGYDHWLSVEFEGMEDCIKALEYDLTNLKGMLEQC